MKALLVVLSVITALSESIEPQKLLLAVYYESKCSDSRNFIIDQLVPTVNLLKDYLHLKLVPFGKAKSLNKGYNGFVCQHGPSECLGNIVQDCTLEHIAKQPDADLVNYVACEMQTLAGTVGDFKCVQAANASIDRVQQCLNSREGPELQLLSEHLTNIVRPKFVPTITINGKFNQQIQDRSQVDLMGTVCSLIPEAIPCAQQYNTMALRTVLL